jgi:hypothetical protein
MRTALARFISHPKALIAGGVVAGLVALVGAGALATKSAGDHFADATFDKLGGDSDAILEAIADKVVDRVSEKGGTLDSAQQALVAQLAGVAGAKLDGVDTDALLDGVKGEVVAAGLGKLDGISTDDIVSQVTAALIAQAQAEIAKLDLDKLAKGALADVAKNVDIDKLVSEQLAKVDVEKLIMEAISTQMGGGDSGSSSTNWLSLLFR